MARKTSPPRGRTIAELDEKHRRRLRAEARTAALNMLAGYVSALKPQTACATLDDVCTRIMELQVQFVRDKSADLVVALRHALAGLDPNDALAVLEDALTWARQSRAQLAERLAADEPS